MSGRSWSENEQSNYQEKIPQSVRIPLLALNTAPVPELAEAANSMVVSLN